MVSEFFPQTLSKESVAVSCTVDFDNDWKICIICFTLSVDDYYYYYYYQIRLF